MNTDKETSQNAARPSSTSIEVLALNCGFNKSDEHWGVRYYTERGSDLFTFAYALLDLWENPSRNPELKSTQTDPTMTGEDAPCSSQLASSSNEEILAKLEFEFACLIEKYKDAQKHGTIGDRVEARMALSSAYSEALRSRNNEDAMDAERFRWWFRFDPPKSPEFVTVYLQGIRERWNLDQWRSAIDKYSNLSAVTSEESDQSSFDT